MWGKRCYYIDDEVLVDFIIFSWERGVRTSASLFLRRKQKRDAKGIPYFVQIFLRQPSIWKFCPEM